MTSFYFEDLFERYASEIDDLRSDSEGQDVLRRRLSDKHREFEFLLSMLDSAPEMVAPAFHGAFRFHDAALLHAASRSEPDDDGFPAWDALAATMDIDDWARPLVEACLRQGGGASFLVTCTVLEWLLGSGQSVRVAPVDKPDDAGDDDGESADLGEAGEEWMSEQGFDAVER